MFPKRELIHIIWAGLSRAMPRQIAYIAKFVPLWDLSTTDNHNPSPKKYS